MSKKAKIEALLRSIKTYAKQHARSGLPWRRTHDPYRILVSEMMLQQTQVVRVIPFYERFIKKFPTAKILARAKLRAVLMYWNGLGYNRRAKYLHDASKILAREEYHGQKLPGVGHYTAAAIEAFAFNKFVPCVETNIRTVLFHSQILENTSIHDEELLPLVRELFVRSRMQPRDFYAAFMDYGSHLKVQGTRLNSKSAHYTKQSKFEGSRRQKRGALIRKLLAKGASEKELLKALHS